MPQAVNKEAPLSKSPTMQSGVAAAGAGVAALVASIQEFAGPIAKHAKAISEDLGLNSLQVAAAILIIVGVVVAYRRYKQRQAGIA